MILTTLHDGRFAIRVRRQTSAPSIGPIALTFGASALTAYLTDAEAIDLREVLASVIVDPSLPTLDEELLADAERIAQRDAELDGEQDEPDFGGDAP